MTNTITTIQIDNLVSESKQFLRQIRSNKTVKPSGIKIHASNGKGKDAHAIIYEQHVYVVVVPEGKKDKALLYGNWDEAIRASQRLLTTTLALQKGHQITLSPYTQVL